MLELWKSLGGIPFLILPTEISNSQNDLINIIKTCDGIIIPGGLRILEFDKFIAKYSIDNDVPVLGICLGMQILACTDCENEIIIDKICEDLENTYHKSEDEFVHKVKIDKNSYLYNIVGSEKFLVNSRHRCKILKTNKFDVVGISCDDGIIEAIERKDKKFAIGVQWHPEMIFDKSLESRKLFENFIKKCE